MWFHYFNSDFQLQVKTVAYRQLSGENIPNTFKEIVHEYGMTNNQLGLSTNLKTSPITIPTDSILRNDQRCCNTNYLEFESLCCTITVFSERTP